MDEIEGRLSDALEGKGEITGGGVGANGSNLDIRVTDANTTVDDVVGIVRRVATALDLPRSGVIKIDGVTIPLDGNS